MIKLLIIILIVIVLSLSCVKVIKQSKVGIVMRLGKFQKKADTGVHFLIPFLDQMAYVIDLRENVVDFPPQPVITKDNVTMQIDTVVYFQVTDPVRYVFEIANPISAIENLTATTLRNIIGELDLDETLTSRDIINTKMRSILDEATDKWGIKVNRVELKNIMPPQDIQVAMEKQMRAERERRESILQAEGEKQSAITIAEGQKEARILDAEADKEAEIRRTFVDMLIVCTLGNEIRLLWSVIYFLFRKDLHEILDSSKKVTREALLELVDKIKNYKRTRTKPI